MMPQTVQAPRTQVHFRPHLEAATSSETAREQWVAFIGKLSLEKGVHCLIAAMPAIVAKVPQARLVSAACCIAWAAASRSPSDSASRIATR